MGKFNSLKDEVVYRATLDGTCDTMGDVEFDLHACKLIDFYGYDYIVTENSQGFVNVERFDHIDIDDTGYFCPVERRWEELEVIVSAWYDTEDE